MLPLQGADRTFSVFYPWAMPLGYGKYGLQPKELQLIPRRYPLVDDIYDFGYADFQFSQLFDTQHALNQRSAKLKGNITLAQCQRLGYINAEWQHNINPTA